MTEGVDIEEGIFLIESMSGEQFRETDKPRCLLEKMGVPARVDYDMEFSPDESQIRLIEAIIAKTQEVGEYYGEPIKDHMLHRLLGNATYILESFDDALRHYKDAAILDSNEFLDLFMVGKTTMKLGNTNEAAECFNQILEKDPKNIDAWLALGDLLFDIGGKDEAMECYEQVLGIEPENTDAWYSMGRTLQELGHWEEALSCFDHILAEEPNDLDAHFAKGKALSDLGRNDEALKYFSDVLKSDPYDLEALLHKGRVLGLLGRRDEAVIYLDQVLAANPNDEETKALKLMLMRDVFADSIIRKDELDDDDTRKEDGEVEDSKSQERSSSGMEDGCPESE